MGSLCERATAWYRLLNLPRMQLQYLSCAVTNLGVVPLTPVEERLLRRKRATLGTLQADRAGLPYPPCLVPSIVPVDVEEHAESIGCVIKPPSVDLGVGQRALWVTRTWAKGEVYPYFGWLAHRKPKGNVNTVTGYNHFWSTHIGANNRRWKRK